MQTQQFFQFLSKIEKLHNIYTIKLRNDNNKKNRQEGECAYDAITSAKKLMQVKRSYNNIKKKKILK